MNWRRRIRWVGLAVLFFTLVACRVKRPETVLPDEKLEAVLYDYHIAKAMAEQVPYNESYKRLLYIESVFRKHGITEAQFDTSMVWLARNPEALRTIYEKVNERLKTEKDQVETLIALHEHKPKESRPGDSIDVWAWQRVYHLTGMTLDNRITFNLPSDPNFQARDTLRWSIRFHFRGGEIPLADDSLYMPVMAMQVSYANDSTISELRRITHSGVETLCLSADTLGAIEKISGFLYYPRQRSNRMLLADSISLMRYHAEGDSMNFSKPAVLPAQKELRPLQVQPSTRIKSEF